MSGYNSQFNTSKDVLPDLTIKTDLEQIVNDDEEDKQEEDLGENDVAELSENEDNDTTIFVGQKKDDFITPNPQDEEKTTIVSPKIRGKDRKERKKREFTPKMKEALAKAREKKLSKYKIKKQEELQRIKEQAVEEYKATQPKEEHKNATLPPPQKAKQPSFEDFCDIMDKYEEYKRKKTPKKQVQSNNPHPNKIVHRHRPRPPMTQHRTPSLLQVQKPTYNKWSF